MKIKRNCKYCGEEFYVTKHKIKEGKGLYCCKQCYTDYKNNNSLQKIITDNCVVCGKGIHLTPYLRKIGRKCCSVECQRKLYTKLKLRHLLLRCFVTIHAANIITLHIFPNILVRVAVLCFPQT